MVSADCRGVQFNDAATTADVPRESQGHNGCMDRSSNVRGTQDKEKRSEDFSCLLNASILHVKRLVLLRFMLIMALCVCNFSAQTRSLA